MATSVADLLALAREADSPHVSLASLGLPVRVGFDDLHEVLEALPSEGIGAVTHVRLSLDFGAAELTVSHEDGATMAVLAGTF